MDLKQLSYFIEVAKGGSISRAAERLNISQPALSIAIKNLERDVGVSLFFTLGHRRELTDEGRILLENAKELMQVYQKTLESTQHVTRVTRGEVKMGIPPLMGTCFFGNIIPSFKKKYPNINVQITEEGALRIDEMIENGDLDIALTLKSDCNAHLKQKHFTTQRNVVLLHKDHPLANRDSLSIADLKEENFAIFNENFTLHRQIFNACLQAGFEPKITLLTSQWDFMAEVVSNQQGISILPKPVYENSVKKNIVAIPLSDGVKYWEVVVVWNGNRYFPKVCEIFYENIIQNLPPDDVDEWDRKKLGI